jgi:hypothetical protein
MRARLQKYVEDPLSEALIQGQLEGASLIEVFWMAGSQLPSRSALKRLTTRC